MLKICHYGSSEIEISRTSKELLECCWRQISLVRILVNHAFLFPLAYRASRVLKDNMTKQKKFKLPFSFTGERGLYSTIKLRGPSPW